MKYVHQMRTHPSGNSLQPIVLGQYSLTLHKKALLINDLELLKQSFDHFETALSFDSNNLDNLGNYGNALADYTELTKDISHLEYAIKLHEDALIIDAYHLKHLNGYIVKLLSYYHFNADNTLLEKAFTTLQKTLTQTPNDTYNLACYFSLSGKPENVKSSLLHAEQHNNLPNLKHLSEDKDLANVRNEQWFIELLERIKAKEKNN